jgi:hypothetical protein
MLFLKLIKDLPHLSNGFCAFYIQFIVNSIFNNFNEVEIFLFFHKFLDNLLKYKKLTSKLKSLDYISILFQICFYRVYFYRVRSVLYFFFIDKIEEENDKSIIYSDKNFEMFSLFFLKNDFFKKNEIYFLLYNAKKNSQKKFYINLCCLYFFQQQRVCKNKVDLLESLVLKSFPGLFKKVCSKKNLKKPTVSSSSFSRILAFLKAYIKRIRKREFIKSIILKRNSENIFYSFLPLVFELFGNFSIFIEKMLFRKKSNSFEILLKKEFINISNLTAFLNYSTFLEKFIYKKNIMNIKKSKKLVLNFTSNFSFFFFDTFIKKISSKVGLNSIEFFSDQSFNSLILSVQHNFFFKKMIKVDRKKSELLLKFFLEIYLIFFTRKCGKKMISWIKHNNFCKNKILLRILYFEKKIKFSSIMPQILYEFSKIKSDFNHSELFNITENHLKWFHKTKQIKFYLFFSKNMKFLISKKKHFKKVFLIYLFFSKTFNFLQFPIIFKWIYKFIFIDYETLFEIFRSYNFMNLNIFTYVEIFNFLVVEKIQKLNKILGENYNEHFEKMIRSFSFFKFKLPNINKKNHSFLFRNNISFFFKTKDLLVSMLWENKIKFINQVFVYDKIYPMFRLNYDKIFKILILIHLKNWFFVCLYFKLNQQTDNRLISKNIRIIIQEVSEKKTFKTKIKPFLRFYEKNSNQFRTFFSKRKNFGFSII